MRKITRTILAPVSVWLVAAVGMLTSCAITGHDNLRRYEAHPKHEFRGAWIHTVHQNDYKGLTSAQFRELMNQRLDRLRSFGINAIIFQVRPEADAFYPSNYEPWSRFLTGRQGLAPDEADFDPMAFLIDACHQRGMEFHAWLNPYRAGTNGTEHLSDRHIYHRYPEWFVKYDKLLLFDPGVPDCRRFICQIVKDIVSRYDIDAIHMDDYFYPYPVAGLPFPDDESFARYGRAAGFDNTQRADWRRDNVNQLIREIKETIVRTKPWVRFGVSPFGIYRNKKSDKKGSNTSGLQNYDDLYADIVLWMQKGWIDYCVPQLYWENGHRSADYQTLAEWWNELGSETPVYIGQSVERTMKARQLTDKITHMRRLKHIGGNVFWPANELLNNHSGVSDSLQLFYHRYPSLIPAYTHQHDGRPRRIEELTLTPSPDGGLLLQWQAEQNPDDPEQARYFVVYRFRRGEAADIRKARNICAIVHEPQYLIPDDRTDGYTYTVTAVDRFHNESKASKKIKP